MKFKHSLAGVSVLLGIFIAMMVLMRITASQVAQLSGGQGIVDLTFGITPGKINSALSCYGKTAAAFYRWGFYAVDMVYALAYCSFYRAAIGYVAERLDVSARAKEMLPILPVVGMAADLFENTVMFILLSGSGSGALMWSFTVFNVIKFVFVYSSLAIVVGGAVCLIKKRLS